MDEPFGYVPPLNQFDYKINDLKRDVETDIQRQVYACPINLYDRTERKLVTRNQLAQIVSQLVNDSILLETEERQQQLSSKTSDEASQLYFQQWRKEAAFEIKKLARYAILSHRWGADELSYNDLLREDDACRMKAGYHKFIQFCEATKAYHCRFVWTDTACIRSESTAELDESIRSMYEWYRGAEVCIVNLSKRYEGTSDIAMHDDLWFSRGWTLQELLAPTKAKFFGSDWNPLTNAHFDIVREAVEKISIEHDKDLLTKIALAAGLRKGIFDGDLDALLRYRPGPSNVQTLFKWMHQRLTTRPEDMAYSLFGLLGVMLPIAYGEGADRAFYRLQVECANSSDDRSLFTSETPSPFNSMLAKGPASRLLEQFVYPADAPISITAECLLAQHRKISTTLDSSFSFTNSGLRIMAILPRIKNFEWQQAKESAWSAHGTWKWYTGRLGFTYMYRRRHTDGGLVWFGDVNVTELIHGCRVAIIGGVPDSLSTILLFGVILRMIEELPPRYVRVGNVYFTRQPPTKSVLLQRTPEYVFIQ